MHTGHVPKLLAATVAVLLSGLLTAGPASAVDTVPESVASPAAEQPRTYNELRGVIDLFDSINQVRKDKGLKPLRIALNASTVAQEWTETMAATGEVTASPGYASDKRLDPGFASAAHFVGSAYGLPGNLAYNWKQSPENIAMMTRPGDNVIGLGIISPAESLFYGTAAFYEYGTMPQKTFATAQEYLAVVAPKPPTTFPDVPADSMFAKEIIWTADKGISTGWYDGTFRPLEGTTRDAMSAFLYRLSGSPQYTVGTKQPFRDVGTNRLFYREMSWLADTGISTGWPDGTFRPWQPVNRDSMAAFLYRAAGSPAYTPPKTSPFKDVATNNLFFKEISWLAEQGISSGWVQADGTRIFAPVQPVNRDAMAAFMYRYAQAGFSGI